MNPDAVFYFALAKLVQKRSPSFVCFQIVGHMFGEHDVPGVAAIHHPLGHVDSSSRDIHSLGHVHHTADRSTVNAHANLQTLVFFKCAADLKRTLRRFLRALVENERHPVAGGNF